MALSPKCDQCLLCSKVKNTPFCNEIEAEITQKWMLNSTMSCMFYYAVSFGIAPRCFGFFLGMTGMCCSSVTMTSTFVPVSGRHCFSFVSLGQFKPPMRMQPLVSSLRLEQYCSSPEVDPGQIYPNSFFSVFMEVFLLIQCSSFFQGVDKIQQSKSLHLVVRVTALVMEVYQ